MWPIWVGAVTHPEGLIAITVSQYGCWCCDTVHALLCELAGPNMGHAADM